VGTKIEAWLVGWLVGILIPPPNHIPLLSPKNPKTSKTEFSLDDKPRRKREITIFAIDLILWPLIFGILSPSFFKTMTLHIWAWAKKYGVVFFEGILVSSIYFIIYFSIFDGLILGEF
jgi:hypothetical protein